MQATAVQCETDPTREFVDGEVVGRSEPSNAESPRGSDAIALDAVRCVEVFDRESIGGNDEDDEEDTVGGEDEGDESDTVGGEDEDDGDN